METILFIRDEYMSGKISHDDYYAAIAKEFSPYSLASALNLASIEVDAVRLAIKSADKPLNTIPLAKWDKAAAILGYNMQSNTVSYGIVNAFKKHGDGPSLAGIVCVLKVAARIMADGEYKDPQDEWNTLMHRMTWKDA
jgi:hypothetical protein